MKRALLLLLLVSLGLNIGLGIALKRSRDSVLDAPRWLSGERGPGFGRPDSLPGEPGSFGPERMHRMREFRERLSPELDAKRAALGEARTALHEALRRYDLEEGEILALVNDMIKAQGGVDSLIVSNLAREFRHMPPEERERILQRLERHRGGTFARQGRGRRSVSP